jgi:Ser-tRNA(Ala) deacylase AlaX
VAITEQSVVLDRTVFYPKGGRQAGDTGLMTLKGGQQLLITHTRKGEARDSIVHFIAADSVKPTSGKRLRCSLIGNGAIN